MTIQQDQCLHPPSRSLCARYGLPILAALLVFTAARVGHAACSTSICTGGANCTISGTNAVDCGCTLDFGSSNVTLTGTLQGDSCGSNCYTVKSNNLTVSGGTLRARGGCVVVNITGNFSTAKVSSSGGNVDARNQGATTPQAPTAISITAAGSATLNGVELNADGASGSFSGDIAVTATAVTGSSNIHSVGSGGGDGGFLTITSSTGEVNLTGNEDVSGGGTLAYGGDINIDAHTFVTVASSGKSLQAQGAGAGDGGNITLLGRAGAATINGNMNVNGNGDFAFGGIIDVSGDSVTTGTTWNARGDLDGDAGEIDLTALPAADGGSITTTSGSNSFNTIGGSGGGFGGTIDLEANGSITLAGDMDSGGQGTDSDAGDVLITAGTSVGDTITVQSTSRLGADSSGTGSTDEFIELDACNISISGILDSRNNSFGENDLTYRGTFTAAVGSKLLADDDGGNNIFCRCVDVVAPLGTCDTPLTCVTNPTRSGTETPTATVSPFALAACS